MYPFFSLKLWLTSHQIVGTLHYTSGPMGGQPLAQVVICSYRDLLECMTCISSGPLFFTYAGSCGEILSSPLQPPEL